jgi:hypothetical protein
VPGHVDLGDESGVLQKFCSLHALAEDDDTVPSWGDMYKLPWCVLIHEQIDAAQTIATGLEKAGHKLAKKCKIGVGEDDNFWQSMSSFAARSKEEVAALPEAQQADFAAVCFRSPEKQKWLLAKK